MRRVWSWDACHTERGVGHGDAGMAHWHSRREQPRRGTEEERVRGAGRSKAHLGAPASSAPSWSSTAGRRLKTYLVSVGTPARHGLSSEARKFLAAEPSQEVSSRGERTWGEVGVV
nr:unnamed protein product [Digitaria exilis]